MSKSKKQWKARAKKWERNCRYVQAINKDLEQERDTWQRDYERLSLDYQDVINAKRALQHELAVMRADVHKASKVLDEALGSVILDEVSGSGYPRVSDDQSLSREGMWFTVEFAKPLSDISDTKSTRSDDSDEHNQDD